MSVPASPKPPSEQLPSSLWVQALFRFFQLLDTLFMFSLGRTYLDRLRDLENDPDVDRWRADQQQEWDRLGQSLALLATMHAAILAITPEPPPLAFAVWLGGASLAVCGLFIVQYFSVKAFGITDEDMGEIFKSRRPYLDFPLMAVAIITPIVSACWAAILFAIGIFDYIVEKDLGGRKYRAIALVPAVAGIFAVVLTVLMGERLVRKVERKYDSNGSRM